MDRMKENLGRFSSPTTETEAKMKDFRVSQAGFKGGIRMRKLSLRQEEEEILGFSFGWEEGVGPDKEDIFGFATQFRETMLG